MNENKIKQLKSRINSPQRIVVAVAVPILTLLIGYGLINAFGCKIDLGFGYTIITPFFLKYTWWMWVLVLAGIAIFEYLWLGTPKQ